MKKDHAMIIENKKMLPTSWLPLQAAERLNSGKVAKAKSRTSATEKQSRTLKVVSEAATIV